MLRKVIAIAWLFVVCFTVREVGGAGERREVEDRDEAKRPKIWQEAKGQEILMAQQVARADAMRKLLERVYGCLLYTSPSPRDS